MGIGLLAFISASFTKRSAAFPVSTGMDLIAIAISVAVFSKFNLPLSYETSFRLYDFAKIAIFPESSNGANEEKALALLKQKNLIQREGATKNGRWIVIG